jgi:hypothetical protein
MSKNSNENNANNSSDNKQLAGSDSNKDVAISGSDNTSLKPVKHVKLIENIKLKQKLSANKKFHRLFGNKISISSSNERLVNVFNCALLRNHSHLLLQGTLYVTKRYYGFYSNIFGYQTVVCGKWSDLVSIKKENVALFFPTAISFLTQSNEKYLFASFISRNQAYKLLIKLWSQQQCSVHDLHHGIECKPLFSSSEKLNAPNGLSNENEEKNLNTTQEAALPIEFKSATTLFYKNHHKSHTDSSFQISESKTNKLNIYISNDLNQVNKSNSNSRESSVSLYSSTSEVFLDDLSTDEHQEISKSVYENNKQTSHQKIIINNSRKCFNKKSNNSFNLKPKKTNNHNVSGSRNATNETDCVTMHQNSFYLEKPRLIASKLLEFFKLIFFYMFFMNLILLFINKLLIFLNFFNLISTNSQLNIGNYDNENCSNTKPVNLVDSTNSTNINETKATSNSSSNQNVLSKSIHLFSSYNLITNFLVLLTFMLVLLTLYIYVFIIFFHVNRIESKLSELYNNLTG